MVRLYLFAEGQAEQTFANTVLCPHLAQCGVYLHKAVLVANSHKKHRIHRGGIRNFQAMQKDIIRFLRQHSGNDVFFTSMIDLYRLPKDFPGFEKADKHRRDPYRRVRMLEKRWAKETGDHRFVPHIQLHEYETYLFVNVSILSSYYPDRQNAITELQEIEESFESPELIDDGCKTSPSRRIIEGLPRYERQKATVGVQAAETIGLEAIRSKCPHFRSWMERLESLDARSED